jgi:hypothetical protein
VVLCWLQATRVAPSSSRRLSVSVRAGADYDRDTGFVAEDNSGRANIFPRKQQAYISSSKADAAAQQGLGGVQGKIELLASTKNEAGVSFQPDTQSVPWPLPAVPADVCCVATVCEHHKQLCLHKLGQH